MEHYNNFCLENLTEEYEGVLYIEEWKDVDGYDGLYEVSSFGRVKSYVVTGKGRIRKGVPADGYLQMQLKGNGDGTFESKKVHRMVAIAFIPNPNNLPEVNHKKGERKDNRAWMLEWSTQSDNIKHAYRVLGKKNNLDKVGEQCYNAKFKNEDILDIRKLASKGVSLRTIADTYNQKKVWVIKRIVNRERWKHI